jgi:addiction module HigA family antidote
MSPASSFTKWFRASSAITPDMALRLEAASCGSAGWWVRMQAAYELAQAREGNATPRIERFEPEKVA